MAKKKSAQRQFSLLELIPECIENLRQECEKEEAYTRRMLGSDQPVTNKENEYVRQTNGSRTNSNESNGQRSIQTLRRDGIIRNNDSLKNTGQMGAEQSGEIERNGTASEQRGIVRQVCRTSGTGNRSDGNEQVLGVDRQRTEPLESIIKSKFKFIMIMKELKNGQMENGKQRIQLQKNMLLLLTKIRNK